MKRIIGITLLTSAVILAQGRAPNPRARASALDLAKTQTIEGTVSAIHLAYGTQYPSAQVGSSNIKLAPVWFFLNNDFELHVGDAVRIDAAPSVTPADAYWYALRITNTATSARIELRDISGAPLWSGRAGASELGRNHQIDFSSVVTISGAIESVVYGPGIQLPSITVQTSGTLVTASLGPERVLLEADIELKAGQAVTAKLGKCSYGDEYVVLELTLPDGRTIVLRDADGTPFWS